MAAHSVETFRDVANRALTPTSPHELFVLSLYRVVVRREGTVSFSTGRGLLACNRNRCLSRVNCLASAPELRTRSTLAAFRFGLSAGLSKVCAVPTNARISAKGNIVFRASVLLRVPTKGAINAISKCTIVPNLSKGNFLPKRVGRLIAPLPCISDMEGMAASGSNTSARSSSGCTREVGLSPRGLSATKPRSSCGC